MTAGTCTKTAPSASARCCQRVEHGCRSISPASGSSLMTAIVAWQVFCRYVLNDSPSWTEPGAIMLMSWFIFLGAAVGVRENYHLGFDVLLYVLPKAARSGCARSPTSSSSPSASAWSCTASQLISADLEHDPAVARHLGRLGLHAAGRRRRADRACSRSSASCCASPARRSTTCSTRCRRRKSRPNSTPRM